MTLVNKPVIAEGRELVDGDCGFDEKGSTTSTSAYGNFSDPSGTFIQAG